MGKLPCARPQYEFPELKLDPHLVNLSTVLHEADLENNELEGTNPKTPRVSPFKNIKKETK